MLRIIAIASVFSGALALDQVNFAPDLKVPEVKAPKVPEVKAPKVPEVKAPKVPEVKAPKAPEVKAPEVPKVKAPKAPEVKAPKAPKVPEVKAPKVPKVPEVTAPKVPEVKVPGVEKKEEEAPAKKEKNLRPIGEGAHQDPKAVEQRTKEKNNDCEDGNWNDCHGLPTHLTSQGQKKRRAALLPWLRASVSLWPSSLRLCSEHGVCRRLLTAASFQVVACSCV